MPIQATAETHRAVGVTAAAPWRVKEMTVVSDYRLAVTFQDGTRRFADLSAVTSSPSPGMYEPLKDPQYLAQARLEFGTVVWPNGADLDPAWMYDDVQDGKTWSVPI